MFSYRIAGFLAAGIAAIFLASCASAPFSMTAPLVSEPNKSLSVSGILPRGFVGPVRVENSAQCQSSTYSKGDELSLKVTVFPSASKLWMKETGEDLTDDAMKEKLAAAGGSALESVQTIDYVTVDGTRWPVRAIVDQSGCRYVFGCKYSGGALLVEVSADSKRLMRQQRGAMRSILKSLRIVQRSRTPTLEPSTSRLRDSSPATPRRPLSG